MFIWLALLVLVIIIPGAGVIPAAALLLCLTAVSASIRRALSQSQQPASRQALEGLLFGALLTLFSSFVIDPSAEVLTGKEIDLSAFHAVEGNPMVYAQLMVAGLLVGGVLEELLFRGYFIGFGMRLFGRRALPLLIICSSLAFAMAHLYQGLSGVIGTGLVGFLLALFWAWRRSLIANTAAHATVNAIGITCFYLGWF